MNSHDRKPPRDHDDERRPPSVHPTEGDKKSAEEELPDTKRRNIEQDTLDRLHPDDDTNEEAAPKKTAAADMTQTLLRRFAIVRPHAVGGLGEVFVANDGELNREVALKQIQGRYADDPASQRRFLLEAEITGRLEHPGIVPVYGLGQYEDGRPYYAMRFIRGESLRDAVLQFFDESGDESGGPSFRGLQFRKLLERVKDVCDAVHYAHTRGVLHRDLKPSNIMLGKFGETLVVDWGLAKVQGRQEQDDVDEVTLRPSSLPAADKTSLGSAVGTPAYMSPEQAIGDLDTLGPASDVYSLGATLYFVATGQTPVDGENMAQLLRRVIAGDVTPIAGRQPRLPAPLRAVVERAMALKPQDRYATPQELAADLDRYLAGEPVVAYRERWRERARRWLRQRPSLFAATLASIAMALIAATILAAVFYHNGRKSESQRILLQRANANADEANMRLSDKNETLNATNVELQRALADAKKAKQQSADVLTFFTQHVLRSPVPEPLRDGQGVDVTVREALDRAEKQIEAVFGEQPEVEAIIRSEMASTYRVQANYDAALKQADLAYKASSKVYGESSREALVALGEVGRMYDLARRTREGLEILEAVYAKLDSKFGPRDGHTMLVQADLAEACLHIGGHRRSVRLGSDLVEKLSERPETDEFLLRVYSNLGAAHRASGNRDEAERIYALVLKRRKTVLPEDHPQVLNAMNNLGFVYVEKRRFRDAVDMLTHVYRGFQRMFGPDNLTTIIAGRNLADANLAQGNEEAGLPLYEEMFELLERKLPIGHVEVLKTCDRLGEIFYEKSRYAEAAGYYRRLADYSIEYEKIGRLGRHWVWRTGMSYSRAEQPKLAIPYFVAMVKHCRAELGAANTETLRALEALIAHYRKTDQTELAESRIKEFIRAKQQQEPLNENLMRSVRLHLEYLLEHDKYLVARDLAQETLTVLLKLESKSAEKRKSAYRSPIELNRRLLARAEIGLKKFDSAEEQLLLAHRAVAHYPRTHESRKKIAELLKRLYLEWGKPEKAKQLEEP